MMYDTFHLHINEKEIKNAKIALVPGPPERVPLIAEHADKFYPIRQNREFNTYLAYINDQPVIITSTGIGGPSVSIAIEELAQLGIETFIRVGTSGAIQPHITIDSVIITEAAVRLDGASYHFAPASFPAVASFECTQALKQAAEKNNITSYIGISASSDTFYPGQERYDTHTGKILHSLKNSYQQWQELGVLNYEMETATLFTMSRALHVKAGCVTGVIINRTKKNEIPHQYSLAEENAIKVAIDSCKQLT